MEKVETQAMKKRAIREAKEDVIYLRELASRLDGKDKEEVKVLLAQARLYCDVIEEPILNHDDLDELVERSVLRRRVKAAVIAICIAVVLAILLFTSGCQFVSGCGTAIKGLGGDIQWAADGYMEEMGGK